MINPVSRIRTISGCINIYIYIFRIPQIYDELHHTISNADYEKDLRLWSNKHGANMAMNWPQFEVCTQEGFLHEFLLYFPKV